MEYSKFLKVYGVCLICSMLVLYLLSELLSSSPALLYFTDLFSKRTVFVLLAKDSGCTKDICISSYTTNLMTIGRVVS